MIRVRREIHETYSVPLEELKRRLGIRRPHYGMTVELPEADPTRLGKKTREVEPFGSEIGWTDNRRDVLVKFHVRFTQFENRRDRRGRRR